MPTEKQLNNISIVTTENAESTTLEKLRKGGTIAFIAVLIALFACLAAYEPYELDGSNSEGTVQKSARNRL